MATTRQTYVVTITLPVSRRPLAHADAFDVETPVAFDPASALPQGEVVLLFKPEKDGGVGVNATWRFDELFSDDADLGGESLWSRMEQFRLLLLPNSEVAIEPVRQFSPLEAVLTLIAPAIMGIAVRSRCPAFLKEFWEARYERRGAGTLEVMGRTLAIRATSHYSRRDMMPLGVSGASVRDACATITPVHEAFVAAADARFLDGDLRGAVTNLTTAMEVAAYALERRESGADATGHFAPRRYLAVAKGGTPTCVSSYVARVGAAPADLIDRLDSLWGTRHEIVHNGLLQVRPHRPSDPVVKREDYYAFRRALSEGLVWMGFRPIE